MALEQVSPRGSRLRRTEAARTLDPSEKGAINYFIGMAVAKLFADKVLDAPWMLHLDVFRPALNPQLKGRSRPDLVGQTKAKQWISVECKGRISKPSDDAKDKAKQQAQRLLTVNGVAPSHAVGAITYLANDTLRFFWRDPPPDRNAKGAFELDSAPADWRHHYGPILGLVRSLPDAYEVMRREPVLWPVEHADVQVSMHPIVIEALEGDRGRDPRPDPDALVDHPDYRADGLRVVAGDTWNHPFVEGPDDDSDDEPRET